MGKTSPASTPRKTARLRWLVAVATPLVAAPMLSACGASFNAQTNEPYQASEGTNDRSGDVYTLDSLIVTDGEGNGTVVSALINQTSTDDNLTSISVVDADGQPLTAVPLAAPIPLPAAPSADQSVQLATDGDVRVEGDALVAGTFVTLTFTFEDAAPVEVDVPVVEPGAVYADVPVGPVATEATASDDASAPPA